MNAPSRFVCLQCRCAPAEGAAATHDAARHAVEVSMRDGAPAC